MVEIDPFELLTAVDILSKLPKDFYENMVLYVLNSTDRIHE